MNARRLSSARSWRAVAIGLLVPALVMAQVLGVLHRIEHAPAPAGSQTAWKIVGDSAESPAHRHADFHAAAADAGETAGNGGVADGHAHGTDGDPGHDCAAFDHATIADAAPIPGALPLDAATPDAGVASAVVAAPLAAQAAGYLARGPPAA